MRNFLLEYLRYRMNEIMINIDCYCIKGSLLLLMFIAHTLSMPFKDRKQARGNVNIDIVPRNGFQFFILLA